MPLYEYSRWVYRVEFSPLALASAQAPRRTPKHIEIPFDNDYVLGKTWIQRLSREPRVPRIESLKFQSESNPEMHYLLKSLLLRPLHLPLPEDNSKEKDSRLLRLLQSYQTFCTSSNPSEKWHACGGIGPGSFERSYMEFKKSMEEPAAEARRKRLKALDYPSFWDSVEVQEELLTAAARNSEAPDGPDVADSEVLSLIHI